MLERKPGEILPGIVVTKLARTLSWQRVRFLQNDIFTHMMHLQIKYET